jgi:V/A-type H+-transporting ATPase subunit F
VEGKVAVLGDTDFVMPFSALGLDTYPVGEQANAVQTAAKEILAGRYGLVVVAENIAPLAEDVFAVEQDKPVPCVVVVPFATESEGFAVRALGMVLKMATGINILQSNQSGL